MIFKQETQRPVPREYWLLLGRDSAFVIAGVLAWVLMHLTLQQVLRGLGLADWRHEGAAQLGIFALAALSSWFGVRAGWKALGLPEVTRIRQRLSRHLPRAFFRARRLSGAKLQNFNLLAYVEGRHRSLTLLHSALLGGLVAFAPYVLAGIGFLGMPAGVPQAQPTVMLFVFPGFVGIQYLARRAHWNWLQSQMKRVCPPDEPARPRRPISVDSSSWTG
ncbi:MAG: hypothetical protein QUV02_06655 [Maricaulis sp.]|uniref:hypothetical protein n=1 Tax=Maricaulis sp. TaxID=1486257 RepID=UPI0026388BBE|nr:hypothetical protein [Maricaulis sp.]MDM7984113.1 hypothetical protein [Maricaulis sp.]